MSEHKIADAIFGDLDKWSKIHLVWEDIKADIKDGLYLKLIVFFIIGLLPAFGVMYMASFIEKNAQFCEVYTVELYKESTKFNINYSGSFSKDTEKIPISVDSLESRGISVKPIPESNKEYNFYLKYYNDGKMQPNVGLNCSWDIKRFYNERIGVLL